MYCGQSSASEIFTRMSVSKRDGHGSFLGIQVSEMSESVFTQYGYFGGQSHSIWGFPELGTPSMRLL